MILDHEAGLRERRNCDDSNCTAHATHSGRYPWELENEMISWTHTVVETGEKRDALGRNPRGWFVYTPERAMVLVLKNDRMSPLGLVPTADEKLALYDTMFAYSATYTVQPDRVIYHLDMSWNEVWSGTEQVRFCKIEGNIVSMDRANRFAIRGPQP
jgi:hypothetical protein